MNTRLMGAAGLILMLLSSGSTALTTETYSYDEAGRLIEVRYGSDFVLSYSYDNSGNVVETQVQEDLIFEASFESEVAP